jgi:hexokinase
MSMGKGFTITSNLDLGKQLRDSYSKAKSRRKLPDVQIVAILNDTVATLISFAHQVKVSPQCKAAMGLIVGTGNNATIPLKLSTLNVGKRFKTDNVANGDVISLEEKILVNTEWSINGTAGPLRELDLITRWDQSLDDAGIAPGFQPFEYMTAGRYLGELGRLIIVDYLTTQLRIPEERLPAKLRERNGLTSTFLGNLRPHQSHPHFNPSTVEELSLEFPPNNENSEWHWTPEAAEAAFMIAKAIQVRAAGMTAAAIVGLLICADELSLDADNSIHRGYPLPWREELMVGYTGGTIVHFQDYLADCQGFLDDVMHSKFQGEPPLRVVLQPCEDGGIVGAGVLAATVQKSSHAA